MNRAILALALAAGLLSAGPASATRVEWPAVVKPEPHFLQIASSRKHNCTRCRSR